MSDARFAVINPAGTGCAARLFATACSRRRVDVFLFVAGQTAADADGARHRRRFAAQFDAALARVLAVVRAAGGRAEDVARMTIYVTEHGDVPRQPAGAPRRLAPAHGLALSRHGARGGHGPRRRGATVEIEATAVLP